MRNPRDFGKPLAIGAPAPGDPTPDAPTADAPAADASAADAPKPWKDYEYFLTKPFDPDGLLEAVREAIGPSAG